MRQIARMLGMSGGGFDLTPNGYIADGLISHYDGIDNVAYGEHDSDSRVWHDLAGMKDLTIVSDKYFTDNSAHIPQERTYNGLIGHFNDFPALDVSPDFTMEVGYALSSVNSLQFGFCFGYYSKNLACGVCKYGYSGIQLDKSQSYTDGSVYPTGRRSFQVVYDNRVAEKAYSLRGGTWREMTVYGTTGLSRYQGVHISGRGIDAYSTWDALYGDVFFIRFYSRKLSLEELTVNRNNDAKRYPILYT